MEGVCDGGVGCDGGGGVAGIIGGNVRWVVGLHLQLLVNPAED